MTGRQWHLDADTYLTMVRAEVPSYDELQDRLAEATAGIAAATILDLGCGTGVTGARVLARHPHVCLMHKRCCLQGMPRPFVLEVVPRNPA